MATVDADESLEYGLPLLARHAHPVIRDIGPNLAVVAPRPEADPTAAGGVLRLVFEKVLEDLPETGFVAQAHQRLRGRAPAQLVRAQEEGEGFDRAGDHLADIERLASESRQPVTANRGEDRVDQPVQPRDLLHRGRAPVVGGRSRGRLFDPAGRIG